LCEGKPDVSENDFRAAFSSEEMHTHAQRIVNYTDAVAYRLSLTLKIGANVGLQEEREGMEPFDGMIEVWWEDGSKLAALKESDSFNKLLEEITELQREFVDFSRSSRFFTED